MDLQEKLTQAVRPLSERMHSLQNRWMDEQEYEDPADYIKAMHTTCQALGFTFVHASVKPFQVIFITPLVPNRIKMSATSCVVKWSLIPNQPTTHSKESQVKKTQTQPTAQTKAQTKPEAKAEAKPQAKPETKPQAKQEPQAEPKKVYTQVLDLDLKDLLKELAETKDQARKRTLRRWMRRLGHKGGLSEQREAAKKAKMEKEVEAAKAKKAEAKAKA